MHNIYHGRPLRTPAQVTKQDLTKRHVLNLKRNTSSAEKITTENGIQKERKLPCIKQSTILAKIVLNVSGSHCTQDKPHK